MKIQIVDAMRHKHLETGYGQMAAAIHSGLANRGHETFWENEQGEYDVRLWCRPPHYIAGKNFKEKDCNVFFTMHEKKTFDGWKSNWPQLLNKCKAVVVPTKWCKDVFEKHGTKVPTYVCRLGVNTRLYRPEESRVFKVLTVHEGLGSEGSREDWQTTLKAFEYFKDEPNISLTIKTWNNRHVQLASNIEILTFELEQADMARLYREHNVFVKNSVTEGWSIPLTEAIATGVDIIAADCPVLRENAGDYPIKWFQYGKSGQLTDRLNQVFKTWRVGIGRLRSVDWKHSIDGLESILNEVRVGCG